MIGSHCNHRCIKGKMPNFNGPITKFTHAAQTPKNYAPFKKDGSYNLRCPKNLTRTFLGVVRTKVSHSGGLLTYPATPKKPVWDHPYPPHTMKIPIIKREKATCIRMRKAGLPINMIHKFLGRSTSWIYRTLRLQILQGNLRAMDMRKLAGKTRIYTSGCRWRKLVSLWAAWEAFLLGEEEEPP